MEQTIPFVNDTVAPESTETHRLRPFSLFNSATRYNKPITIIASIGENNELGKNGDLCWHIREDLKHFKELTMGGAVIMGRKTWDSLPKKPLPGRTNIVISRSEGNVGSLEEALSLAQESNIFIIGGASVYTQAMPLAILLEITRIFASDPDADTFFPPINPEEWELTNASEVLESPEGLRFRYETFTRIGK